MGNLRQNATRNTPVSVERGFLGDEQKSWVFGRSKITPAAGGNLKLPIVVISG